jgi:hypothetical protein
MAQARGLDGGRLAEVWEAMAEALRAVDGPPPG